MGDYACSGMQAKLRVSAPFPAERADTSVLHYCSLVCCSCSQDIASWVLTQPAHCTCQVFVMLSLMCEAQAIFQATQSLTRHQELRRRYCGPGRYRRVIKPPGSVEHFVSLG